MDTGLSRHLFFIPFLYRPHRALRRHRPRRARRPDRVADPAPDAERHAICRGAQQPPGSEPAQCRGDHRHGHGRPHFQALGRSQSQLYRRQRPRQRRRRRARRDVESFADAAAIHDSRGRSGAGDQSDVDARHHHRRLDSRRPRLGAGRHGHCQLARFRRRAAKLAAPVEIARAPAAARRADAAQAAGAHAGGAERRRRAARSAAGSSPRTSISR